MIHVLGNGPDESTFAYDYTDPAFLWVKNKSSSSTQDIKLDFFFPKTCHLSLKGLSHCWPSDWRIRVIRA
jgi:hypothetical protein